MKTYLAPLNDIASETKPVRGMPRQEAEIIAGRIASARHWRRRRAWLRLRVAAFGRRKAHHPLREAPGRRAQAKDARASRA